MFVKTYITIGLFFYFKKIEVRKHNKIPKDKPVLFLGNHQNALLDPLLIAVKSGRYAHFLTRAQVFKKPLVAKILKSLQLIPVYRVRDGWQNISQNNAIFSQCVGLLNKNEAVTIFPEGSHNLKRVVRPLSKGFTRIIFEVLETNPETELQLIPIGFNYKNAKACPDEALLVFGEAIKAANYNFENKHEAIKKVKSDIHIALSKLTTHIDGDDYDVVLNKLKGLNANFLKPEEINGCINSNFETCIGLSKERKKNSVKAFFKMLLIITCCAPYLVWKKIVQPKIKEIEFTSTFRFAIALVLVPLWLLIIASILYGSCGIFVAFITIISILIIAILAVKL